MSCCNIQTVESPIQEWGELIEKTNLDELQKKAIKTRVLSVVKRLRQRLNRLTYIYSMLRTTTSVGSLLVPSLLAIQSNVDQTAAYWSMWGIGLLVSISNAFVSLFRVDKNYYTVGDLIEKIESESWMYLTLSGRYDQSDEEVSPERNHQLFFSQFMERCEVMMNKAIRTEYLPGNATSGGRSIHNEASVLTKKAVDVRADPYSFETVIPTVDDRINRPDSGSGGSIDYVRRPGPPSDSTEESGGVPAEREAGRMVSEKPRSPGISIKVKNERVSRHDG